MSKHARQGSWNGNPRLDDGYVSIAQELLAALNRTKLSDRERRLMYAVITSCYAWRRDHTLLSTDDLIALTGMSKNAIYRACTDLERRNMLTVDKSLVRGAESLYRPNRNYRQWVNGGDAPVAAWQVIMRYRKAQNRSANTEDFSAANSVVDNSVSESSKVQIRNTQGADQEHSDCRLGTLKVQNGNTTHPVSPPVEPNFEPLSSKAIKQGSSPLQFGLAGAPAHTREATARPGLRINSDAEYLIGKLLELCPDADEGSRGVLEAMTRRQHLRALPPDFAIAAERMADRPAHVSPIKYAVGTVQGLIEERHGIVKNRFQQKREGR